MVSQEHAVDLCFCIFAADKITHIRCGLSLIETLTLAPADDRQILPRFLCANVVGVDYDGVTPLLLATVPCFVSAILTTGQSLVITLFCCCEGRRNILKQQTLVPFHGQSIVAAASNNLGSDFGLTAHGI